MKKLLIAALIGSAFTTAQAADIKPYVEGQLGYANLGDVDTQTLSVSGSNFAVSGKAKFEYDSDVAYGFEIGLRDVVVPNLRIGASYSRSEFDFDKATLSATATINGNSYSGSGTATRADVGNAIADELNAKINLYMLNVYYDFKNSTAITPFVGAGIGIADIKHTKDNEFAFSLSGGAKYNFTDNLYLGLKGTYLRVNGPTISVDNVEVPLDDVDMWKAEALVGYQF